MNFGRYEKKSGRFARELVCWRQVLMVALESVNNGVARWDDFKKIFARISLS